MQIILPMIIYFRLQRNEIMNVNVRKDKLEKCKVHIFLNIDKQLVQYKNMQHHF